MIEIETGTQILDLTDNEIYVVTKEVKLFTGRKGLLLVQNTKKDFLSRQYDFYKDLILKDVGYFSDCKFVFVEEKIPSEFVEQWLIKNQMIGKISKVSLNSNQNKYFPLLNYEVTSGEYIVLCEEKKLRLEVSGNKCRWKGQKRYKSFDFNDYTFLREK